MTKSAQKAAVEQARLATLASPEELIGALTWWSVTEVLISREELTERCEKIGLDPKAFMINSRPRSAFRRALEEAETMNLIRKIVDDAEKIVFGIVEETADEANLDLNYATQNVIIFKKESQTLEFKLDMDPERANALQKRFQMYMGSYTSHEVRSMIHSFIRKLGAFPVRDKGGVYFVPKTRMEEMDKLSELISTLNGSYIYVLGIRDEEKEKEGMKRSWENALSQELKVLEQEIQATVDEGNAVRASTLEKRGVRITSLKNKAQVYNDLFGNETPKELKKLNELLETIEKTKKAKFGKAMGQRKVKVTKKEEEKTNSGPQRGPDGKFLPKDEIQVDVIQPKETAGKK